MLFVFFDEMNENQLFCLPHTEIPAKAIRTTIRITRLYSACGTRTVTAQYLRKRRWLHTRPTTNYSLLTANWTFTFSAKEKDSETGLSYFGSRYYSSDLSIWLSVDPMAAKYPSLSPYVYCANNPVRLVDPNGEEIGNYYDINGDFIGSDKVDDNKVYLVSDQNGISKDDNGNIIVKDQSCVHELPDFESRGEILDKLIASDNKYPNSEWGGCYGQFWNKEKQMYESPETKWGEKCHYNDPAPDKKMGYSQIHIPGFIVIFDYHSHGSGKSGWGVISNYWAQPPSPEDISNVKDRSDGLRTFAVFGMESQKVYFYDQNGQYASWSFDQFRNNR